MKIARKITPAIVIETAICLDESRSSSGEDSRAEIESALNPIDNACPSAITPRRPG